MRQVLRRVQMAEGEGERARADPGERRGIAGPGLADGRRAGHPFGLTATCTSRSCFSGTGEGASVIRSCAVVVLGKAITSRIDSVPAISAAMRSMPKEIGRASGRERVMKA